MYDVGRIEKAAIALFRTKIAHYFDTLVAYKATIPILADKSGQMKVYVILYHDEINVYASLSALEQDYKGVITGKTIRRHNKRYKDAKRGLYVWQTELKKQLPRGKGFN